MDFRELLAMAQKNNKDAQVQLKTGNLGPVTEYNTPGAREAKAKLDMARIAARVNEAKSKQQALLQKPQQLAGRNLPAQSRPGDTSKKKLIAPPSSLQPPKLNNRPTQNGVNASTKPPISKPSLPQKSSSSQLSNKTAPATNGQAVRRPDGPSLGQVKSFSSKPPQTNGHPLPNNHSKPAPVPAKKRINPAPPIPSYHDLLNAAQNQHREHIQEPEKFFLALPPPVKRVESTASVKGGPPKPSVNSTASTRQAGHSQGESRNGPVKTSRPASGQVAPPPGGSRRNSTSGTSSSTVKPPLPTAKVPGSYPKRPVDGTVSSKITPAAAKSYAHVGNGNRNVQQNGQRGGMPSRDKIPLPVSNGRPTSSNPSSSRLPPAPARSLPLKPAPVESRNPLPNGRPAERNQPPATNGRPAIRPAVTSGRPPILPARQNGMPPPSRIPPSKIAPARRQEPPAAPSQPAPRRNIVYPNGPSFPAFRPGYKAPKRRIEEDEEEDDEDDMADFIDDGDMDEDNFDVSKHLREIFPRYDPRRFVGRDEEDDDLAHMETRVEDQWREEERSAKIGELEDELEEELEQLQAKVQRVKAIKNKKARKF